MRKFLFWLSGFMPCRLIYEDGEGGGRPYLQRYYVCSFFGLRVYLHRFVASDPDRGLHSHPWTWALSLILSGWYYEQRFSGDQRVEIIEPVRRFNFLMGESHHRVILPFDRLMMLKGEDRPSEEEYAACPIECWTLFIHRAGHKRRWGFLHPLPPAPETAVGGDMKAGGFVFNAFQYPGGVESFGEWWKAAPRGAFIPNR